MNLPLVHLIAALDRQRVIGREGALPWHLPDDLKRFKRLTLGHPIVMGRKTWDSIGRPLPGRRNLVLTRQPGWSAPGAEVFHSPEAILHALTEPFFVIGGGEIYRTFLPFADVLHLTEVATSVTGDATFPPLPADIVETAREHHPVDAAHALAFDWVTLKRRR